MRLYVFSIEYQYNCPSSFLLCRNKLQSHLFTFWYLANSTACTGGLCSGNIGYGSIFRHLHSDGVIGTSKFMSICVIFLKAPRTCTLRSWIVSTGFLCAASQKFYTTFPNESRNTSVWNIIYFFKVNRLHKFFWWW